MKDTGPSGSLALPIRVRGRALTGLAGWVVRLRPDNTSQTREPGFRRAGDSGEAGESQPSPRGPVQTPRPARQGERAGRRTGVRALISAYA